MFRVREKIREKGAMCPNYGPCGRMFAKNTRVCARPALNLSRETPQIFSRNVHLHLCACILRVKFPPPAVTATATARRRGVTTGRHHSPTQSKAY